MACLDQAVKPDHRATTVTTVDPIWIGIAELLLLASILDEFDGIVRHQTLVRPRGKGTLDPMIDRGRVPGLAGHFDFSSWIADAACRIRCFDFKGLEGAGSCGQGFLSDDLR